MLDDGQDSTKQATWQATGEAEAAEYVGQGVRFERIRRITGYLVGDLGRFNNAKRAEVRDRIKHLEIRRFPEARSEK